MPRGIKKNATPKSTESNEVFPQQVSTTKLDTLLFKLRNTCRTHGIQTWNKQSLCDQIYQDLLFLYHLPRLQEQGILPLNSEEITNGAIKDEPIGFKSLLKYEHDEKQMSAIFHRVWKALQSSIVEPLFKSREFAMFSIEKDEKKVMKYYKLLVALFKDMSNVILESYDSNAGYTYFKKDLNKNLAKTFGQFYTPKSVLTSVVEQVDPKSTDLVLDPSCGSCSFLQESGSYIVRNENKQPVEAFANLYGVEVERDIYTEGVMNIFINFGFLPDMENNIREVDAFVDLPRSAKKYDKIVANPPFGATVTSFKESYHQTIQEPKGNKGKTVKKIIVHPDVLNQIPFPNIGESAILFFQMIVSLLKDGGKAGVVMSSTILNDSYFGMMEWFLNCCSLEKIIINPAGTFKEQGTGIETMSFIYTKGSPTTTVSIVMLGDENTVIRTLTMEQIREAGWKLDIKGTVKKEEQVANPAGFPMVKLGDITVCKNGKNIPQEKRTEIGTYPYYASNGIGGFVEQFNFQGPATMLGDQGSCWAKSAQFAVDGAKFYAGNHTIVMKTKNESLHDKYLYYYLKLSDLKRFNRCSALIPELDKLRFYDMEIPLPPLPIQQTIVQTLDRIYNPGTTDLADTLKLTSQAMDLVLANPGGATLEPIVEIQRMIRNSAQMVADVKAQMVADVKAQMVAIMKASTKHVVAVDTVVKSFCSFEKSKIQASKHIDGEFPFISLVVRTHNVHILEDEEHVFISATPAGNRLMRTHYYKGKCAYSSLMFHCILDKTVILPKYYYWYLFLNKEILNNHVEGIQPRFNYENYLNMNIPIPPLDFQQSVVSRMEALESQIKALESLQSQSEDNARFILDSYLTTKEPVDTVANSVADDISEDSISHE